METQKMKHRIFVCHKCNGAYKYTVYDNLTGWFTLLTRAEYGEHHKGFEAKTRPVGRCYMDGPEARKLCIYCAAITGHNLGTEYKKFEPVFVKQQQEEETKLHVDSPVYKGIIKK